jgi:uncharacterized membrane protein YgcG
MFRPMTVRMMTGGMGLTAVLLLTCGMALADTHSSGQARVSLDRSMPAVNLSNVSLKDAIDFVRDISGANVHVNWRALEAAGVTGDTTVNVRLRGVSLRKVLNLILSEASGGVGLTFYVDDGVVEVTTSEIADSMMYTIVYPVQDLLFEPPVITAPPDFDLSNAGGGGGGGGGGRGGGSRGGGGGSRGGGGGGGGGQGLFGSMSVGQNQGQTQEQNKTKKQDDLITLIVETVQPSIWAQNGGKATIKFFQGNLVITAPRSVHEMIGGPIE